MKRTYETPQAEMVEFNYAGIVLASGKHCDNFITLTQGFRGCEESEVAEWAEQV